MAVLLVLTRHCTIRHVAYLTLPLSLSLSHTHTHIHTHTHTHTRLTHQALSLVISVTPLSHLVSLFKENLE